MTKTIFGFGLLLALPLLSSIAYAEDCTAPCFSYDLTLKAFGESALVTKPRNVKDSTVINPSNSLSLTATPVDGLSFIADLVNESVIDPVPGKTKVFKGVGLYADELYAEYSSDSLTFQAGKFGPPFSLASQEFGGDHGADFASNFDTNERWGALMAYDFAMAETKQRFSVAAFTSDRTFLSESLFTNRQPGGLHLSDGGAGNTKGVSSLLLLWDGCQGADAADCYSDGDWGYRFGGRWQKTKLNEDGDPGKDEVAATAAAFLKGDVGGHEVKIIAEGDYTPHLNGGEAGALTATLGTEWDFEPVTVYAALALQNNIHKSGADTTGYGAELSADYALSDTWTAHAGYSYFDSGEHEAAHFLNVALTYEVTGPGTEKP